MTALLALSACAIALFVGASSVAITPAVAAPGDLDASFSGDGRELTDFGGSDVGHAVALQADGKLVVVGRAGGSFALARYNPDGTLDTSFATDGKATIDFDFFASGEDVAIQSDGKIVVVGSAPPPSPPDGDPPPSDFAVARYNVDGTLDTSFGTDGKVTTDFGEFGATEDGANGVALQGDGRIVVAGFAGEAPPDPFGGYVPDNPAVARYNADGTLDTSFSGDGRQTMGASNATAQDVAIQPDSRIVLVGLGGGDFVLARYTADGSPDNSFGSGGKVTTDMGGSDHATSVAIQPDGKILATGYADHLMLGDDLALARYNPDGSLDATFSGDGILATDSGGNDRGAAVALQSDGNIVVAGMVWELFGGGWLSDFALTRYHPDGSPDLRFAGDGKQITDFGPDDRAEDVIVQSDGKIVAVGRGGASNNGDFALARYQGASVAEPGASPTNLSGPTISGSAIEGETLTASAGTWSGSLPITLGYQWRRCDPAGANCVDIAAETTASYTMTGADVGHTIRVRETATNAYGTGSVESAATTVVKASVGAIAGAIRSKATGLPIARATVDCGNGYSAKTANDGLYTIANVAPGEQSCTASAKRYLPSTQTVTVAAGQTTTADFTLLGR